MNSEQMKNLGIAEVYLPIDDFPNYEISNYGNVRNVKSGQILKACKNCQGYYYVWLYRNAGEERKTKKIFNLVTDAFMKNSDNNKLCIHHIDGDISNNCLFNLRFKSHQETSFGKKIASNNVSGYKGVSFEARSNKWRAQIKINGKNIHIGYYNDIEDAKQARQAKAKELFDEYINQCELN